MVVVSVTTKVVYGEPEKVKILSGEHTVYVEQISLLIMTDEWALRSQDAFILKRASSSQHR
jgi:hypothetical protein